MKFLIWLSVLLPAILACKAQPKPVKFIINKDDNTLLWEVSGKGMQQPSFIFGTFHILCKDDIHFSEQLKMAVANAGIIYMELDMDDPSIMLSGLLMMTMKDGKELKDLYTEAEYAKVSTFFNDSLKMPIAFLKSVKPLFLESLLYPKMMNCRVTSGIEEQLMKLARQDKKEIKGLETIELQASVFDSIPYEVQAKELLRSIDSIHVNKLDLDSMINIYRSQQLSSMEDLFTKDEFDMEEYKDVLLDNRNKNWVNQLKDIMPKQTVFVAVGAGHLPGKMGLLELLRKEGYTVRPLQNK